MRKFKYVKGVALIAVFAFLFSGCASIVSKSAYNVTVSSNPSNANISIKNRKGNTVHTGKTPMTVNLKAGAGFWVGETYTVNFKKDGFAGHSAQIERGVDGWYIAGNLFFGGLLGWLIIDPLTGAMWTLKDLNVNMDKRASLEKEGSEINIVLIEDIPLERRSDMVRVN